jgi:phosphoribosylglycinamide formyltransferase-1
VNGDAERGAEQTGVFRLAVLASGSGSNLQAIIDRLHHPELVVVEITEDIAEEVLARGPALLGPAATPIAAEAAGAAPAASGSGGPRIEVALVVSDVPDARALRRARLAGIRSEVLAPGDFSSRSEHDLALAAVLCEAEPDLVVLAGYMRLVAPAVIRAFPYRIINLHPALLPSFPGTTAIADALRYGVKVTGVTVHFVDEGMDTGPVIAQEAVRVEEGDTEETLAARIHAVEHRLLPQVITLIAEGRVRPPLPGTRVVRVD